MSRKFDQSETHPFKSIFKEGYVTPANYLCELIFQRRGEFDKNNPPQYLWNNDKFKKQYIGQLVHINSLLKEYSISTLLKAFKETSAISVTNKKFISKVKELHAISQQADRVINKTQEFFVAPKSPFSKPNPLGDL